MRSFHTGNTKKRMELIKDVRGFGVMLPKGTVGLIGNGAYAYAIAGMCAYDVEVPVTDLEPHGAEKTIGIGYKKLRLIKCGPNKASAQK